MRALGNRRRAAPTVPPFHTWSESCKVSALAAAHAVLEMASFWWFFGNLLLICKGEKEMSFLEDFPYFIWPFICGGGSASCLIVVSVSTVGE